MDDKLMAAVRAAEDAILDPASPREAVDAAVARVDAFGDRRASAGIRQTMQQRIPGYGEADRDA